jgi:hypothetical protein
MKRFVGLALCLVAVASAAPAQAGMITGSVKWDAGLSTPRVGADHVSGVLPPQPPAVHFDQWSAWTFSNKPLPANGAITGEMNISALVKGESAAWHNVPFSLTFVIHDGPGPNPFEPAVPGAVTFSGELNGTLTRAAGGRVTSNLDIDWLGATTKTLDLNHHLYTLSISAMTRTGTLPDPNDLGEIRVGVNVRQNPEPAGLVLAALALPALALGCRRKRK